ncbi:tetratricopeptide repeat protein [Dysgonomonas sp. ZJ279]|uniref:tetratricopeptide repeat protein n=1 Tax=Dysgonomonas sp. ZJ279 TaxID=2709796 RepID=UPI0013EBCDF9|nr:hypothetical protein [Dysgonomonas sp. ZJ279]
MLTLFDFSRQIASLRKEKKYLEILTYFKENKVDFSKEQIANHEYIVSDIMSALRYTNQFDAGFQFLRIYDICIAAEQKERVLSAYGWLLWAKYKFENQSESDIEDESVFFEEDEAEIQTKNFSYNRTELIERIENLISILFQFDSEFTKTLNSNLFLIVLKSEKKKTAPNWKLINDFCSQIDRESLSQKCSIIQVERKGQTKEMELASDFENWYAYKTKALMKLGEWQECFDTSKEALEKIESFHYSNDVWFSRRIALSKKNLGNTEDAIKELETILKKKREWFIQKELAELYFEKNDLESAFKMAISAINNFGLLEFKVDLFFLLGKILKEQGILDLAFKHFSLSKLIRQEEEWKISQKIVEELTQFSEVEIPLSKIAELKNELKKYWNDFNSNQVVKSKSPKSNERNSVGEVVRILHDNERGKVGFIKSNENEHYFAVSSNFHLTPKIIVGSKIVFQILPAVEGEKEQVKILKLNE